MSLLQNLEVIPVWPDSTPGPAEPALAEQESNLFDLKVVRNVTQPTLTAYFPAPSMHNGTTVIVCPGGAFHFLSWEHEGTQVADWLNPRGVTVFLLKYRLIHTPASEAEFQQYFQQVFSDQGLDRAEVQRQLRQQEQIAISDGQQAIRRVRGQCAEWGLAPDRIGMLGFSAGGSVTLGAALGKEPASRPDFAAPIYAAPRDAFEVSPDAPPLFVVVAADDGFAAGSVSLFSSWKAANRPAELHVYARGGHGFGMRKQGLPVDSWIDRFGDWLEMQGLLSRSGVPAANTAAR